MTLQDAIMLGIKLSIALTVFAVGLEATVGEITYLFRHPRRFIRAILAIDIVMPLFVLLVLLLIQLPDPIKIALAALSVSPVPPLMPGKAMKAGGTEGYVVGLLVAAAVVALVFVPLSVELIGRILGVDAHVPLATVVVLMAMTVLGPLVAGVLVRGLLPDLARHAARPLAKFAAILLILCVLPVMFSTWSHIWSLVGNGALAAFTGFVLVGLAVGHFLGGPGEEDRTVLAIATASRHPGMAIAVAASSFPEQKLVAPAVIMYLIVGALVSLPYSIWRKRRMAALHLHAASN
jgi:BASS family bile acid:Na+ symporter